MLAGMNALRLNFSHGKLEQHAQVVETARALCKKLDRPVSIIADLQGPKIRVGILPNDGLPFVRNHVVHFQYNADFEQAGVIPVQHDVSKYLKPGENISSRWSDSCRGRED
jgi:pyruvate kinase